MGTGEVKEMWVEPTARGSLLGAAILAALAGHARATGITELRLAAARHLEAAVDQFQRFGFEACAPWGEYAGAAHSLTMSTALGPIRRCRLSSDDA
jgi:putative acetyltransferase